MSKRLNKAIFGKIRDANIKYRLIEDGDRIAVGMSGGKDSLTLLYFLHLLNKYTPLNFDIVPIYLDLGWKNDISKLEEYCSRLNNLLIKEETNIAYVIFEARKEKNPCSLCSNLRRGALNRAAKQNACNKVALGHHMDDAVNTMLMSMIFEGRYHLFKPRTYLDRMDLTIIRPLIYVEEKEIISFVDSMDLTPIKNPCPADGYTKREEMKHLLEDIEFKYPGARKRFLNSIENVDPDSFWN